eukprot:EG_transcript_64919
MLAGAASYHTSANVDPVPRPPLAGWRLWGLGLGAVALLATLCAASPVPSPAALAVQAATPATAAVRLTGPRVPDAWPPAHAPTQPPTRVLALPHPATPSAIAS